MRIAHSLIASLVLSFSTIAAVGCATGADDDFSETEDEASAAGKLTFWQASDAQWHFNLKSGNGSILLTSEAYKARTSSITGALSVLDNGVDPAMYTIKAAAKGYVVTLKSANGAVISTSETYATKSSATRAVTACVKAVTSLLDKRESATGARAEVLTGASGQFRFNIFASNGKVVLSSEQYTTEAAAFNGAMAVQTEGQNTAAYNLKQNASGGYYFTVQALNGEIVGTSEQYTTKTAATDAMASLRTVLKGLTVL
ncbi:MAG: DUF1508 domain-containing protein [Deltaproteobacteria bacterium]|nr:DUF1508 domain-containing protein [Deltaproteobacteria bacterium]